jgi:hypothetical protein
MTRSYALLHCPNARLENQHPSSVLFLIVFRYTAERQCPIRIGVAVRAIEFWAPSGHDFLGGDGGCT